MDRPGTEQDIKRTFDAIDVDGTGLVEWNEYAFSLMGEKAMNYGPLADLETLDKLLLETDAVMSELRGALLEAKEHTQFTVEKNDAMRERLLAQKNQIQDQMGNVMGKMLGMMGQAVEDMMTGEQIEKLLIATFNKFDADRSGQLEYDEFKQAFFDLGLNGTEKEIQEAFKKVDADGSGFVDRVEFTNAVKSSRMAELSLNVLISQMDGKLDGLEDVFVSTQAFLGKIIKKTKYYCEIEKNDTLSILISF